MLLLPQVLVWRVAAEGGTFSKGWNGHSMHHKLIFQYVKSLPFGGF